MAANGTGKLATHYLLRALEDFPDKKCFPSILLSPWYWWIHVTSELAELISRQTVSIADSVTVGGHYGKTLSVTKKIRVVNWTATRVKMTSNGGSRGGAQAPPTPTFLLKECKAGGAEQFSSPPHPPFFKQETSQLSPLSVRLSTSGASTEIENVFHILTGKYVHYLLRNAIDPVAYFCVLFGEKVDKCKSSVGSSPRHLLRKPQCFYFTKCAVKRITFSLKYKYS